MKTSMKWVALAIVAVGSVTASTTSAMATQTPQQADHNVMSAGENYAEAEHGYREAARISGSGVVGSAAEDTMRAAGERRAQAAADQRAAYATARNKAAFAAQQAARDSADTAQVARENMAHNASLKNMHTNQDHLDTLAPGITKESNPVGHPTGQPDPEDANGWTQTPGITKESNPLGHPVSVTTLTSAQTSTQAPTLAGVQSTAQVGTAQPGVLAADLSTGTVAAQQPSVLTESTAVINAQPVHITDAVSITAGTIPQGSTINVAVTAMKPGQPVAVTINGVTQTVTAGRLAHIAPQIQVSVPMNSAFMNTDNKANTRDSNVTRSEKGTGNGGNNAANSNSAHGLGGGSHIGGGSQQNGGFHGNW